MITKDLILYLQLKSRQRAELDSESKHTDGYCFKRLKLEVLDDEVNMKLIEEVSDTELFGSLYIHYLTGGILNMEVLEDNNE